MAHVRSAILILSRRVAEGGRDSGDRQDQGRLSSTLLNRHRIRGVSNPRAPRQTPKQFEPSHVLVTETPDLLPIRSRLTVIGLSPSPAI